MSFYGENIKLSLFGQSHSAAIGMSLEGIPAGFELDMDELMRFMRRRAPGRNKYSTARKEDDVPEFLCGFVNGVSCGTPITAIIRNNDARPEDYEALENTPRPGHADYTAGIKYCGYQDRSGGGMFSGRLTAALCIAGGICIQLLEKEGIKIISRIYSIGGIKDSGELTDDLSEKPFPVNDDVQGAGMRELMEKLRAGGDSAGGIIECRVLNLPAGLGGPLFEGMESRISAAAFAIPGVKGIDFGAGTACAGLRGSENNDEFALRDGKIITLTNNCGGILGGISDGMPLSFRLYIKPTPSVAVPQRSVDTVSMEETEISVRGRHDPCIVPRALPCAEAAAAVAVYDMLLGRRKEICHEIG